MRSKLKPAASRLLGRFKEKKKKMAIERGLGEATMARQGEEDKFGEVDWLLFIEGEDKRRFK